MFRGGVVLGNNRVNIGFTHSDLLEIPVKLSTVRTQGYPVLLVQSVPTLVFFSYSVDRSRTI